MLLQNDLCCDEVFGLIELSYLQCHIILSLSKGTYIKISPFSATSECNFDLPSKDDQNKIVLQNELRLVKSRAVGALSTCSRIFCSAKGPTSNSYFLGAFHT